MTNNLFFALMVFFTSQACAAEVTSFEEVFPLKTTHTEEDIKFSQYFMSDKNSEYTFPRAMIACSNNKNSIIQASGYGDRKLPDKILYKLCPICQTDDDVNREKFSNLSLGKLKFSAKKWNYFGESFEFYTKNPNADMAFQAICITSIYTNESPYILVSECSSFYPQEISLLNSILRSKKKWINNVCTTVN